jgi:hypothetical protein
MAVRELRAFCEDGSWTLTYLAGQETGSARAEHIDPRSHQLGCRNIDPE